MNKREQQRIERRQEILDCSLDMIISRGYEGMKIRDIADKLGISIGLFFNYFESKEKIYEELVKIGLSGPMGVIKLFETETESIELFLKMTQSIFNAVKENSMVGKMFVLMAQTAQLESVPASVKVLTDGLDVYTPIIPFIVKGQQDGKIKAGNPASLAYAYWACVQGICEGYSVNKGIPLPDADWVVDILRA